MSAYREREGISQEELAHRLGISRNYVSMIESGKKVASEQLQRSFTMLESSPLAKKPKITRDVVPMSPRLVEESGHYGRRTGRTRVPIISMAQAGELVEWDDIGQSGEVEYLELEDPDSLAFRICGDSMEPRYPPGTIAIIYPNRPPRNENLVIARLRDGSVLFKRVQFVDGAYHFISTNQAYKTIIKRPQDVERIFPVGATFKYEL